MGVRWQFSWNILGWFGPSLWGPRTLGDRFKASIIDPVGNSAPQPAFFPVWYEWVLSWIMKPVLLQCIATIHLQHCNVAKYTVHLQPWLFSVPMWICIHCFSAPAFFLETDTNYFWQPFNFRKMIASRDIKRNYQHLSIFHVCICSPKFADWQWNIPPG